MWKISLIVNNRISKTYKYESEKTFKRGMDKHGRWCQRFKGYSIKAYILKDEKWVDWNERIDKLSSFLENDPVFILTYVEKLELARLQLYTAIEKRLHSYNDEERQELISILEKTIENGSPLIDDQHISKLVAHYQKSQ